MTTTGERDWTDAELRDATDAELLVELHQVGELLDWYIALQGRLLDEFERRHNAA